METEPVNRELTVDERQLVVWMLENGNSRASEFLCQVDRIRVTPWRCPCGCASLEFAANEAGCRREGLRILGDYVFGSYPEESGIFIFEQGGECAGIEVYGLGGDASPVLPTADQCHPFVPQPSS